ncbi:MAG: hypothetical protein ACKKMW_02320 [Candidatus Nealsonbacteria bacterium]
MKKTILISFVIFNLIFSGFCLAENASLDFEAPETFEEAQQLGEEALEIGKKQLPDIIRDTWYNNVLPMWQKMYNWAYINIWLKAKNFLGPRVEEEIETRKEIVEEEIEQEKEEVKKELPGFLNKIWKFIRDIFQKIKILWK